MVQLRQPFGWRSQVGRVAVTLGLCLLLVAQLVALKALPYARGQLERVSTEATRGRPGNAFRLGSITWDVAGYSRDPGLEPLRSYYREVSPDLRGVPAARAVLTDFARRFPFGPEAVDFFHPAYDMLADFDRHVRRGEPGHCVSRSGLLASVLLANGIPARVVSAFPSAGRGHNITEVWDDQLGWVMVDPSTLFVLADNDLLAGQAVRISDAAPRVSPPLALQDPNGWYFNDDTGLLTGSRVYPEPWLYTRAGRRQADWPFRGRFAVVGVWQWRLGPAQMVLRAGVVLTALALAALVAYHRLAGRSHARRRAARVARDADLA